MLQIQGRRISLFIVTVLLFALVPVGPALAAPPRVGTYNIGQAINESDPNWVLALTTIQITREPSTLKVHVLYQNVSGTSQELWCPPGWATELSIDGQIIDSQSSVCAGRDNSHWSVGPEGTFESWGSFVAPTDRNSTLRLTWAGWGQTGDFKMPRKDVSKIPELKELLQQLAHLGVGAACLNEIALKTATHGYPYGTAWGLTSLACKMTLAEGVKQGIELFKCLDLYPFSTCVGYTPEGVQAGMGRFLAEVPSRGAA